MSTIKDFTELEIWQRAREQARDLFNLYTAEPFSRDWELRSQVNRSSGSVMDNIAEGFERSGNKEFIHYLLIAKGSNGEVRSQLLRAFDRSYLQENLLEEKIDKNVMLSKMINTFIQYLKNSDKKGFRYS